MSRALNSLQSPCDNLVLEHNSFVNAYQSRNYTHQRLQFSTLGQESMPRNLMSYFSTLETQFYNFRINLWQLSKVYSITEVRNYLFSHPTLVLPFSFHVETFKDLYHTSSATIFLHRNPMALFARKLLPSFGMKRRFCWRNKSYVVMVSDMGRGHHLSLQICVMKEQKFFKQTFSSCVIEFFVMWEEVELAEIHYIAPISHMVCTHIY